MRKVMTWVLVIAGFVFVIDWGVLGVKIFEGDFLEGEPFVYIGAVCVFLLLVCAIYFRWSRRK